VVEYDALLGAHRVRAGDAVVAMAASGLHANGYSLARHVFFDRAGWDVDQHVAELGRTLGEELLEPTRIYARACLAVAADLDVHAFCHVTGGGLAANLARVLPPTASALVDRSSWSPPPIFGLVQALGGVARAEAEQTFNQGVGMVALVAPDDTDRTLATLTGCGVSAWVAGEVVAGDGHVTTYGEHPT
jgi:phosphoribosylformylglycinamidine cyclo-ligase